MATRQITKNIAGNNTQQAQRRGRRILIGLFGFIVCVLAVDALVGDQGLLATMRARKQYNQLASDLVRLRTEVESAVAGELLASSEEYLRSLGAEQLHGGGNYPLSPFYYGL